MKKLTDKERMNWLAVKNNPFTEGMTVIHQIEFTTTGELGDFRACVDAAIRASKKGKVNKP